MRGPDTLLGQDIRELHVPPSRFDGVIGGPPCQDYSRARRQPPTGYGDNMIKEFGRLVIESKCKWWLMECVPGVPSLVIHGYTVQRFNLYASEFGLPHRRNRSFQYGSTGSQLTIARVTQSHPIVATPLASQACGNFRKKCRAMGLPESFNLPGLSRSAKHRAVGNGVAVPVSFAIASAIKERGKSKNGKNCPCGCGRLIEGFKLSATPACRKRLQRRRRGTLPRSITVTAAGSQPD